MYISMCTGTKQSGDQYTISHMVRMHTYSTLIEFKVRKRHVVITTNKSAYQW